MIFARPVVRDSESDLALAFRRLGLPTPAQGYLLEKIPHLHLLVTGIGRDEGRVLKSIAEQGTAPGREEFPSYCPGDVAQRPGTALLSGRRDQFERLTTALREASVAPLADAIARALEPAVPGRVRVMGILNVTPDSFSDGGAFASVDAAVARGLEMARAGAELIDVGGESTRPGAKEVSADEELARVLPVVRGLTAGGSVAVSVDTRKARVAEAALEAGASFVNDVSGLTHDPRMGEVIARHGAKCCVMHLEGTPETMQLSPHYDDVVEEVLTFLSAAVDRATSAGVPKENVCVDPGIGFAKTAGHNWVLLRCAQQLRVLGQPILWGVSRKAFLGAVTGGKPAAERVTATVAAVSTLGTLGAADWVRVHDVAEAVDALRVVEAIRAAAEGGAWYERPRRADLKG